MAVKAEVAAQRDQAREVLVRDLKARALQERRGWTMSFRQRIFSSTAVLVLVLALAGCGGGSGSGTRTLGDPPETPGDPPETPGDPPETPIIQPEYPPALPQQGPANAGNAPVIEQEGSLQVNPGVAPAPDALMSVGEHEGVRVAHGSVRDGVGAAELIDYLRGEVGGGQLDRFGMVPPTVYVAEGSTAEMIDQTVRAVQLINAALPVDWQLRFGSELVPRGHDLATYDFFGIPEIDGAPDGAIHVEFARMGSWIPVQLSPASGRADTRTSETRTSGVVERTRGSRVWVDHVQSTGTRRVAVVVHEILHALGRDHADPARFPESVMVPVLQEEVLEDVLHPLDREALLAVYAALDERMTEADILEALGSWDDTSMHVRGGLDTEDGEVAFGAGLRNGLARPWASGPAPHANIEDNEELSESATWSGRLLGLTPATEVVGGVADLTIRLESLDGALDLTALVWCLTNTFAVIDPTHVPNCWISLPKQYQN